MATQIKNVRTRKEWAERINANWRKTLDGIQAVGNDLIAAKNELTPAEYTILIHKDLLFSAEMARRLRACAEFLNSADRLEELPNSWRIMEILMGLMPEDFEWAKQRGLISPKTSLRAATALRGALDTPEGETWGENLKPSGLPKPSEAREIARETNRGVAASDGNIYFGVTEEEEVEVQKLRTISWRIRDAINDIASIEMTPKELMDRLQSWQWPKQDEIADIPTVTDWLLGYKAEWEARNGGAATKGEADSA